MVLVRKAETEVETGTLVETQETELVRKMVEKRFGIADWGTRRMVRVRDLTGLSEIDFPTDRMAETTVDRMGETTVRCCL